MPKLAVNGVDINYLQAGTGPDLVLIHGLAANLAFWYLPIVPRLTDRFKVTVLDLRGHGLSGMPSSGYTTWDMALDLHGLLDELAIDACDLAGHSYGAAVALHFTTVHAERVRSLALFDCRVNSLQPIRGLNDHAYWEQRRTELEQSGVQIPEGTPKVLYDLLAELAPLGKEGKTIRSTMPGMMADGSRWNPASRAARRWMKLVQTTTLADDIRQSAGLTADRIARVDVPTLLSYGGVSSCMPTCRGLEASLKQFQTTVHPDLGHYFPIVEPQLVVEDLRRFLPGDTATAFVSDQTNRSH